MVGGEATAGARKRTATAVARAKRAAVVAVVTAVDELVGPSPLAFPTPVRPGVARGLVPRHHRLGLRLNRWRQDRPLLG